MSALPIEHSPAPDPYAILSKARSFGRLRAVTDEQAPVVREAVQWEPSLAPRWQRGGQGVHDIATPADYANGVQWIPTKRPVRADDGRSYYFRRVTAGVPHLSWRNRDWWLTVLLPAALDNRPEAWRGTIARDTILRMAEYATQLAHRSTGRCCIVRVDRFAEVMQCSEEQVRRFWRALQKLGVAVLMRPGRMLTAGEKHRAYQGGSTQRGMANEWAFVTPSRTPRHLFATPGDPVRPQLRLVRGGLAVDTVTPARGTHGNSQNLQLVTSLTPEKRSARKKEPPPAAQQRARERRSGGQTASQAPATGPSSAARRSYDPDALAVARGLTEALAWLNVTRPGRLEPALRRFVSCRRPWSPRDFVTAIDQLNQRLGRASMTRTLVKNPPALLASYLRQLDPDADHPRAWMDVETFARPTVSRQAQRNRQLLDARRAGDSMTRDPQAAAAALAKIRAELAAQRSRRDSD